MSDTFNTLIISDLHLGEDLNPSSRKESSPQLALLERQLVGFLRRYTFMRRDGRAWRLIINGDLVDFLGICLLPGDDFADVTPEEQVYGLGRRPRVARAKMEAVLARHPDVFRALGRFAAAGNRIDIVVGNHDVEFQWKPVQASFIEGVRRAWEDGELARGGSPDSSVIAEQITFHPWFFYEPGVVWVEHGHLYDENCSLEFALAPGHPDSKDIDVNVDVAAQRYVMNQIPTSDHGQENWSWSGYLSWARSLGLRGSWNLIRSYWAFTLRLLSSRRERARMPAAREARRARHRARLRALCETWSLDEKTLDAVHELRTTPVTRNLWRLLQVLMIDKLVIGAATLLFLMVAVWSLPLGWSLLASAAVIGSAWMANDFLGRSRNVDPTGPLMEVPDRILRHVDAKYVVFGHSHEPLEVALDGGGTYFNTGTWLADEFPGLLRSFTHVVIRHTDSGAHAELCQWRDGASRSFTPGYRARGKVPAIVGRPQPAAALEAAEPAEAA